MTLSEATRQYQNALEAHRRDPDCEGTWQEVQDARSVMTTAWLNETATTTEPEG